MPCSPSVTSNVGTSHCFKSAAPTSAREPSDFAGEIASEDVAVKPWIAANAPVLHYLAPAAGIVIVVAAGLWLTRRHRHAVTP